MVRQIIKSLGLLSLIYLISVSCYYDNEEELYPTDPNNPNLCATDSLTYDGDVASIINAKCAIPACHGGSQSPALSNFTEVSNNLDRIRVRALEAETMPPPSSTPLTDCEKQKLGAWINSGAPQN